MERPVWCAEQPLSFHHLHTNLTPGTYDLRMVFRLNGEASRLAFAQGQTNRPHETRHGGEHDVEFL